MTSIRRMIRGIIFDLDETLIDSLGTYWESFNRGTAIFSLKQVTEKTLAHLLDEGYRLGEILIKLFPAIFTDKAQRQLCENEIRKAYHELQADKVGLKPGVNEILQSLKDKGLKMGIVTGRATEGEGKWRELRRLNIGHFVDVMVTAAEAPAKPAPDGILKCIRELGLSAEECVFIGDSRVDIMAGKKAGVKTVAVLNGVANEQLIASEEPDCVLTDLNLLVSYLDRLRITEEDSSER